jgi:hypothetical protein
MSARGPKSIYILCCSWLRRTAGQQDYCSRLWIDSVVVVCLFVGHVLAAILPSPPFFAALSHSSRSVEEDCGYGLTLVGGR